MRNTQAIQLLCEQSKPGVDAAQLPACDVPRQPLETLLPAGSIAAAPPPLPSLTEPELTRHFVNLSTLNMSVDTHFYPLGSCTMKYNPKRNDRLASLPGFADVHPYQPESTIQGLLEILYQSQEMLAEIGGMDACSLQPAAGAHGEMTALFVAAAYFRDMGDRRTTVLIPDTAHGTNPASAARAGFKTVEVKSDDQGLIKLDDLAAKLNQDVGVLMVTNPNTLGIFERRIEEIARMVHEVGGLVYLDGANMNAILGIARPGDFGADMMHYNPHKTFSGPHGGGGPGAGPVAVVNKLALSAHADRRAHHNGYRLDYDRPKSIGRVQILGSVGVLLRMYSYVMTHGPDGLRAWRKAPVLNANYLLSRVKHILPVPAGDRAMHDLSPPPHRSRPTRGSARWTSPNACWTTASMPRRSTSPWSCTKP